MHKLTLSVPTELKERMDSLPYVNWPEVFRSAIKAKAEKLKKFNELCKKGDI